jgi:hypothetical protein
MWSSNPLIRSAVICGGEPIGGFIVIPPEA